MSNGYLTGGSQGVGPRKALALLASFAAISVVGGLLAAGLALPEVGVSGSAVRDAVGYFDSLPSDLDEQPLSERSTILASDGSLIATFYEENRTQTSLGTIAPIMRRAIIAIEDSRFYEHGGVDLRGTLRALVSNASSSTAQGGSTLTQQYVKNVLLEKAVNAGDDAAAEAAVVRSGPEGYARKLREMKLAISLERNMTKDEILERYLNVVLFGNNVFGVQTAARFYFGKDAKALTLPEAALLAGLVQNPSGYNPLSHPDRALARRNLVLGRMLELKIITQKQHDAAAASPLQLNVQRTRLGCEAAAGAGYFCDYAYRVITTNPIFGKTPEERRRLLRRGGLTVRTTMDPRVQKVTQDALQASVPVTDPVGTAAVVVEPGTGRILAMSQNRVFSQAEGSQNTKVNYSADYAYGQSLGFQPGSTFKAFTLATWLSQNRSLSQVVAAPPRQASYRFGQFTACGQPLTPRSKPYRPFNSESEGSGHASVLEATYKSVNTAYMEIERQLDLCTLRDTAQSMGIHISKPVTGADGKPSQLLATQPSMTLGAQNVSPLAMAGGYATFAARGIHCDPIAIDSVTNRAGQKLKVPSASCKRVLTEQVADGVNFALQRVLQSGGTAGPGNAIGRPAAGKTGTANDSIDTWFIGYTPHLTTTVWVGDPLRRVTNLAQYRINGRKYAKVFGATIAAPTWKAIMTQAPALLQQPPDGFPSPTDTVVNGPRVPVPDVSGLTRGNAVATLTQAGFRVARSQQSSSRVTAGRVIFSYPRAGVLVATGSRVSIVISSGRAPVAPPPPPPSSSAPPPPSPSPSEKKKDAKPKDSKKKDAKPKADPKKPGKN